MSFGQVEHRRTVIAVAGAFALCAVVVRWAPVAPADVRVPLATILGLAAICAAVALLMDPHAAAQPSVLHLDGPTIVRTADRRDSGLILATIDDVVMDNMGWTEQHRQNWKVATATITIRQMGLLVITATDNHRPIGVITLGVTDDPNMFSVGMWLGRDGREQGHMRRALTLVANDLCARGFSFRAETATANEASKKSLEGAGFEQIGVISHRLPNGVAVDALIYARYAASAIPSNLT